MDIKRLGYIDSLRGIASLIVAIFWHYQHFSDAFQPNSIGSIPPLYQFFPARFFYSHGDVMVDLFFVLSGVIFSYTYRAKIGQFKVDGYSFFVKRFSRLYPIHLLTLLLAAVLAYVYYNKVGRYPLFGHNDAYNFDTYHFLLNVLFLQKGFLDAGYSFNVPAWSLSIEAFMYLLFFLQSRFRYILYSSLAFIVLGLIIYRLRYDLVFLINEPIARGLIGFFTGCMLYEVFMTSGFYKTYRWLMYLFYILTILGYFIFFRERISLPPNLVMVYFSVLLITELHHNRVMRSLLDNKVLIMLGDISLSVYLIHVPIQFAILLYFEINHLPLIYNDISLFFVYGSCVVGVGWLLYVTVEKPAQNWLRQRMKRKHIQPV